MLLRKQVDRLLRGFERDFATHNRIEVSGDALRHNLGLFQRLTHKQVIPVLKGNAYGHGVVQVAQALKHSSVPYLAVDGYFEALRVREVSSQPVLVMGAILPENFARMKYDGFAFVVQDEMAIRGLAATGKDVNIHLEYNTGMNRYGADLTELENLLRLIGYHKNLRLEGFMSHLADSDADSPDNVHAAVARFDEGVELVHGAGFRPRYIHVAQSAGSLRAESAYANAIRLGIGLYGLNPFDRQHPLSRSLEDLRPSLRFVSTITKVIPLAKGDHVGYGYTFTAPKAMRIGVIPAGYYEGVNRALSNAGVVQVAGQFAPIVGRVCMNHTMISLENVPAAKVGDEVLVYSDQPQDQNAFDMIAAKHHLFNYNLLTALSPDVRRQLIS